jgi:hypothetical protein
MDSIRKRELKKLESLTNSKLITIITSNRPGFDGSLDGDVALIVSELLLEIGNTSKLTVVLDTDGGDFSAGWTIANLLKENCDELSLIVPRRAMSAGALVCLPAKPLYMTRVAHLGPFDLAMQVDLMQPSPDKDSPRLAWVRAEDLDMVTAALSRGPTDNCTDARESSLGLLANQFRLDGIGGLFRIENHYKEYAKSLLEGRGIQGDQADRIVDYLTGRSGSHDMTFSRMFLEKHVQLPTVLLPPNLAAPIETMYRSYASRMGLLGSHLFQRNDDQDLRIVDGIKEFAIVSVFIESLKGGSYSYVITRPFHKNNDNHGGETDQEGGWEYEK